MGGTSKMKEKEHDSETYHSTAAVIKLRSRLLPPPRPKTFSTREQTPIHKPTQHATHESNTKSMFLHSKGRSAQPEMFWRTRYTKSDPKSMRVMPLCLWGVKTRL
jgi:hypothetical protein